MMLIDISRAHFYGLAKRRVFCRLPEGHEQAGKCALLRKSMYGTLDAASIWQATYVELLKECGIEQCVGWPALFMHKERDLRFMVHGDDFVALGDEDGLKFLEEKLNLFVPLVGGFVLHLGFWHSAMQNEAKQCRPPDLQGGWVGVKLNNTIVNNGCCAAVKARLNNTAVKAKPNNTIVNIGCCAAVKAKLNNTIVNNGCCATVQGKPNNTIVNNGCCAQAKSNSQTKEHHCQQCLFCMGGKK